MKDNGIKPARSIRNANGGLHKPLLAACSENKLAFLNHLIGVNEYEVDASGNYEHRLWQWK